MAPSKIIKHLLLSVGIILLDKGTVCSGNQPRRASLISPRNAAFLRLRGGSDPPTPFQPSDPTPPQEDAVDASIPQVETVISKPSPVVVEQTTLPAVVPTAASPSSSLSRLLSSNKMQNAIERTGPALLLLSALYLLVKYTGETGFMALIPLVQLGMYVESTNVIEAHRSSNGIPVSPHFAIEWAIEKWWWFATVLTCTSGRSIGCLVSKVGTAKCELICFGMVALGLVLSVCGMATHSDAGPDHFRSYLGQVAGYHFALVSFTLC